MRHVSTDSFGTVLGGSVFRLTTDESFPSLLVPQSLERHRKQGEGLTCKRCVQEAEATERAEAAARRSRQEGMAASNPAPISAEIQEDSRPCADCGCVLGSEAYNRNQWNKGAGKSRCRDCVERSVAGEAVRSAESKQRAIDEAQRAAQVARESGNALAAVQAESALAALEAEKVTGLKPQTLGGRGRSRGGGRGGGARGGTSRVAPR
jgi:hypothetical protein